MMRITRWGGLLALTMMAAACATTPIVYEPADRPGDVGFRDQRIESDRYRVTYVGPQNTPSDVLQDFALLRAAELTLADGQDWFDVVNRRVETGPGTSSSSPRFSIGVGLGSSGGNSSVGVGVNTGFGGGGGGRGGEPRAVVLEIVTGSGDAPDGAYQAAEVAANVRATRLTSAADS